MDQLYARIGTTVSFDTTRFPFAGLFLARINQRGGSLAELSRLHEVADEGSLAKVYQDCYQLMGEPPFVDLYRALHKEVVAPYLGVPFRYQIKPGIRIHLPGTKTVQYHTDEWYGHGKDVLNLWMPLTNAHDSNSLFVASLDDSLREVGRLEADKATMATINERLARVVRPLDLKFGQVYVFNAQCVHGTEQNCTGTTRVSLDFRLLPSGGDSGTKSIGEYYRALGTNGDCADNGRSVNYQACSYLFGAQGFTRHISNANQRLVCVQFAKQHGIQLLAEETEIRTMPHHPTLLALAEGKGTHEFNSVVLFSVLCLPREWEDRQQIYRAALEHTTTLFFANEQLAFAEERQIDVVEETWHRLLS